MFIGKWVAWGFENIQPPPALIRLFNLQLIEFQNKNKVKGHWINRANKLDGDGPCAVTPIEGGSALLKGSGFSEGDAPLIFALSFGFELGLKLICLLPCCMYELILNEL